VNWRQYVVLAKGLAKQPYEASRRSAASRAYYGAFNSCRHWLEANVTPIDNRGAHEQVWETFKTAERASDETRAKWRLVGNLGDSLHMLRNQADYDAQVQELEARAEKAVLTAERILQLLPELEVAG
jgi:uncharacterized protein (UPF0332 family)